MSSGRSSLAEAVSPVLMLEPAVPLQPGLRRCGKIQYPRMSSKRQLTPEECFRAVTSAVARGFHPGRRTAHAP